MMPKWREREREREMKRLVYILCIPKSHLLCASRQFVLYEMHLLDVGTKLYIFMRIIKEVD